MTSDTERLAKIREQARIRQANYYQRNKELIKDKKRAIYLAGREAGKSIPHVLAPVTPRIVTPAAVAAGNVVSVDTDTTVDTVEQPRGKGRPDKFVEPIMQSNGFTPSYIKNRRSSSNVHPIDASSVKTLSFSDAVKYIKLVYPDTTKNTAKTYIQNLRRIVTATECVDILECFKKPVEVIEALQDKIDSVNTNLACIQTISRLIEYMNLDVPLAVSDKYGNEYDRLKTLSRENTAANKDKQQSVSTFPEYLQIVEDRAVGGKNSKFYMIAKLYSELTVRDDFRLKIVANANSIKNDDSTGFIVVPSSGALRIIQTKHKTDARYGAIDETCSADLSQLIRGYITRNSLKMGDYLFGKRKLTNYLSIQNKRLNIGITGGTINNFRHMRATGIQSRDELATVSTQMKHNPVTNRTVYAKNPVASSALSVPPPPVPAKKRGRPKKLN